MCDAIVSARDGTYRETLTGDPSSCRYHGAIERPGTYTINVTWGAKQKTLDNVRVSEGRCHVELHEVTVSLDP